MQEATLLPGEVVSREKNENALSLNKQWEDMARGELQILPANKRISDKPDATANISCRVDIVYGSRAARYFVGFGAGSGSVAVAIEMRDCGGVRYATNSKAHLGGGVFGADMAHVIRSPIRQSVAEFGACL